MSIEAAFWDWAVAAYGAPDVQTACLELQDTGGQSVPLLLWAAWCAATGRRPDTETIEAACDAAQVWQDAVVGPLRAIRVRLKIRRLDMDDARREAVRESVKAVELEAERQLMAQLSALAEPMPTETPAPFLDALIAVARQWDASVPRVGLQTLAARLPT